MKSSQVRNLGVVAVLGLCAFTAAEGLRGLDVPRLFGLLRGLGGSAVWILVPMTVGIGLESRGWQQVIRGAGYTLGFGRLWGVRFVTEAIGQSLPGGALLAETLKPALLERYVGLPIEAAVAATLLRKYLRLVAHGLYVALAALLGGAALLELVGGRQLLGLLCATSLGLLLLATLMFAFFRRGRLAVRLLDWGSRLPSRRLQARLRGQHDQFAGVDQETRRFFALRLSELWLPALLCLAAWFAEAIESWLILRLLGVEPHFGALLACDIAVQLLRQLLVFLPAGWGVQDAGYLGVLRFLAVPDPVTVGTAFVLLKRARELGSSAVGLGLWWASARVSRHEAPPFRLRALLQVANASQVQP